jgi:hypothetical protein
MDQAIIYIIILLLLGALLLFFGLRIMKIAVAIIGFLFGYAFVSSLGLQNGWDPTLTLMGSLAAGLLVGVIAFAFYRIAVGVNIALFIANIGYSVVISNGVDAGISLIIAIIIGVLAFVVIHSLKIVDALFAVAAALQGASLVVAAVLTLLDTTLLGGLQTNPTGIILQAPVWWIIGWIALAAVGAVYQIRQHQALGQTNHKTAE